MTDHCEQPRCRRPIDTLVAHPQDYALRAGLCERHLEQYLELHHNSPERHKLVERLTGRSVKEAPCPTA